MRVYYGTRSVGSAEIVDCGAEYRLRARVSDVPEGPFRLAAAKPGRGIFNFGVMMPCLGAYALEKPYPKSEIGALRLNGNSELFIIYPGESYDKPTRVDFTELGFPAELAERLNECGELINISGERYAAVKLSHPETDRFIHLIASARVMERGGEYYLAYKIPETEKKTGKN